MCLLQMLSPYLCMSSNSIDSVSCKAEVCNINEIQFIILSFLDHASYV